MCYCWFIFIFLFSLTFVFRSCFRFVWIGQLSLSFPVHWCVWETRSLCRSRSRLEKSFKSGKSETKRVCGFRRRVAVVQQRRSIPKFPEAENSPCWKVGQATFSNQQQKKPYNQFLLLFVELLENPLRKWRKPSKAKTLKEEKKLKQVKSDERKCRKLCQKI